MTEDLRRGLHMRRTPQRLALIGLAVGGALAVAHCQSADDAPAGGPSLNAACCALTPNADLAAGVGRIVVSYPGDDVPGSTRLDVYPQGEPTRAVAGGYGAARVEIAPGTYDVTLGGKRVAGVAVKAGHETRIRAGVVHAYASGSTRIDFYDPVTGGELTGGYGERSYGFPVGEVEVAVAGERATVAIEDGTITEF